MIFRIWFFLSVALTIAASGQQEIQFNRDVRPILSNNCYYCHGPDKETQEADLSLDTFEGATRDLGGYAAIVPGDPESSEAIIRIHDEEDLMPPDSSKKILTKEEKEILEEWIRQGAEYESHWSFRPLTKHPLPEVSQKDWVNNEIDHFVLKRLEEEGIKPSDEAESEVLIRRLYLDLLGLLPTPQQLKEFLEDDRRDAYERLVDRLLASPHYGERWGRHWLDQARYADSNGYAIDSPRDMWPYRDWVINALNEDMPFDQFTIEQLAGDLLDSPSKSQLIATAFHRNTLINQEGGVDTEQFRVEAAMDRINTTSAVWLGLTLSCAQCHTHKFDPIQHREYFEMYAFFNTSTDNNNKGKTIPVRKGEVFGRPTPNKSGTISSLERELLKKGWEGKKKSELLRKKNTSKNVSWVAAKPEMSWMSSNKRFTVLEDQSLLIPDDLSDHETFFIKTTLPKSGIQSLRLRVLTDDSLPNNGPGQAVNGNFLITEAEVWIDGDYQQISDAKADHSQDGYPAIGLIDKDPETGWAINRSRNNPDVVMNAPHHVVLTLKEPLPSGEIEIRLKHDRNKNYHVGRFAIDYANDQGAQDLFSKDDHALLSALSRKEKKRNKKQKELVEMHFTAENKEANLPVDSGNSTDLAELMIMEEQKEPRQTFLLTRGDFTRPDRKLGPLHPGGLSSVAPPMPAKEGRNRLDLANWLIDPKNPLTPRVTMNRVWMRYFGRGLVETEEDFGIQGSLPSHPELLDWLGLKFIENDWSMKAMHRLIVTSATYRQSSHTRLDLADQDPRNLLLARQSRNRVEAEIVRDAALSASGLLNPEIGGPSVFPEQPQGVYAFTQKGKPWPTSKNDDRFRRALYTAFYRSAPYPLFTTFDSPDFSSVCTKRVKSNTPLQALNLTNDPVFMEFAQALALRLTKEFPNGLDAQIRQGFLLCYSRYASNKEFAMLKDYIQRQEKDRSNDSNNAEKIAGEELMKLVSPESGAALVSLARVLLNTDNFITRE